MTRLLRAAAHWLGARLDTQGPACWADFTHQEDS